MNRLVLRLPASWTVLEQARAEGVSAALAEHERVGRAAAISDPLLYATMLAAIVDESGLEDILLAGLVVTSVPSDEFDQAVTPEATTPKTLRDVEVSPGVSADFGVVTIPAALGDVTALLTFGTPNLPRWDDMYEGFQLVAATARWADAG